MRDRCRFLLALDDSAASERAARYLGQFVARRPDVEIHLLHVLPPFPPELLETGGAATREEEARIEAEQEGEQRRWVEEQTAKRARPLFDRIGGLLEREGVASDAVLEHAFDAIPEDRIHQRILDAARGCGCDTVVVGRSSRRWIRDLLELHVSDDVVKHGEGFTVWVVE